MTAKQKKLFLLTSMMSVFVMAVAVLFTGGKLSLSPFGVRGTSSEPIEGSITWTTANSAKTSHSTYNKSFLRQTTRGTGIYLYSIGYWGPTDPQLIDTKTSGNDSGLFVTSEAGNANVLFSFQNITKVVVVTGSRTVYNAGFDIYAHGLGASADVQQRELSANETYTFSSEVLNGTSLVIKPANTYEIDITSVTVEYSCTPGGVPSEKSLSSISVSGQTTSFTVGDAFSFGGTVTAHYSDYSSENVTSSATFSGYDMSESGDQTVTVSYTEKGVTKTTTYSISVVNSSAVTFSGQYNFSDRNNHGSSYFPRTLWTNMKLTFFANGKCEWYNERQGTNTDTGKSGTFKFTLFLNYVATNNGTSITFELTLDLTQGIHAAKGYTSYFNDGTGDTPYDYAKGWSGGGTDRPLNGGFTVSTSKNDSGVMNLGKTSFTIKTYQTGSTPYSEYDTFTFVKA